MNNDKHSGQQRDKPADQAGAVHVFLGPSLDLGQARALAPDAVFLPPAGLGDIHALARAGRTRAICLIDGRFQSTPAVWHKEILYALSRGIACYGAASMGALRAAELAGLGMHGVGGVFEQYASGALEDDDEVAVLHGPAELGYPGFSYAMVSLRCAFERAQRERLVEPAVAALICARMKALHFTLRSRDNLERIVREALPAAAHQPLLDFVTAPEQDLKRDDAMRLLRLVAAGPLERPAPAPFEETAFWRAFAEHQRAKATGPARHASGEVLSGYFQLRAAGADAAPCHIQAEAWTATLEEVVGDLLALAPEPAATARCLESLRRDERLLDPAAVRAWLARRQLDAGELRAWARARALRQLLRGRYKAGFLRHLRSGVVRSRGFEAIGEALARRAAVPDSALRAGASWDRIAQLWTLYREEFGGAATPLHLAAEGVGFDTSEAFLDALLREYLISTDAPAMADDE